VGVRKMCCPPAAAKVPVLGDQRGSAARAERTARKSRRQFFRAVHATLAFTERNFQTIHAVQPSNAVSSLSEAYRDAQ
jgi:hypothetical protein